MSFIIQTNPDRHTSNGVERFAIFLRDSELPAQGVVVGGSTRFVETRYPGSSDVSVQMIGTQQRDITIKGTFNDVWTGRDGGARNRALSLKRLLESQQDLLISWRDTIHAVVVVKAVQMALHFESLIEYSVTFLVLRDILQEEAAGYGFTSKSTVDADIALLQKMREAERWTAATKVIAHKLHALILDNIDVDRRVNSVYQSTLEVFGG